jgi:hypothetical protein
VGGDVAVAVVGALAGGDDWGSFKNKETVAGNTDVRSGLIRPGTTIASS